MVKRNSIMVPTPNSKRRENLSPKSGSTFSSPEFGVTAKYLTVFIKTFGWQMDVLQEDYGRGFEEDC